MQVQIAQAKLTAQKAELKAEQEAKKKPEKEQTKEKAAEAKKTAKAGKKKGGGQIVQPSQAEAKKVFWPVVTSIKSCIRILFHVYSVNSLKSLLTYN